MFAPYLNRRHPIEPKNIRKGSEGVLSVTGQVFFDTKMQGV
jgi:hypothetical protein